MDLSLNLPAFCVAEVVDGVFIVKEVSHVDNKKDKKITTAEKLGLTASHLKDIFQRYDGFDVIVREKDLVDLQIQHSFYLEWLE